MSGARGDKKMLRANTHDCLAPFPFDTCHAGMLGPSEIQANRQTKAKVVLVVTIRDI